MKLQCTINGQKVRVSVPADQMLLEFLRSQHIYSVKRGCDTSNCGLCTVWVNGKPVLSCSYPALRAQGAEITTLEGVQKEAEAFAKCMAEQGAEQCGYCSPGFIMTVLAMERELKDPTLEEMKQYLEGCLCRCTGYSSHLRALKAYFDRGEKA